MAATALLEAEARALCAITKTASPASWQQGVTSGALKNTFGVVCDPPRRGLVVEVYINRGHKVKRRTLNFGLWDTSAGGFERAYQLTVADSASPTHTERGVTWFGSHEHMGEAATKLKELDALTFADALKRFCATVSLVLEDDLDDPTDPSTFTLRAPTK